MHHVYTRRIVIALVLFFALLAIMFGPLVTTLRLAPEATVAQLETEDPAVPEPGTSGEQGPAMGVTLPDGQTAFDNLCTSCHRPQAFVDDIADSLDPGATSLGQLEKLVGPPAHGGASPAEALAIVIHLRTLAGLPSTYEPGVATPPAAATAAAAEPTPTEVPANATVAAMTVEDFQYNWDRQCGTCHEAEQFAAGLKLEADPDLRTRQAIEFLSSVPTHRNRPAKSFLPAMNYIRYLADLEPLS